MCDVCKRAGESVVHMMLGCECLKGFFLVFREFLRDRLGLIWDKEDSWEVFFLFGKWEKSKVRNGVLCRFLISHARWAIKARRNLAHFEQKKVDLWKIFKSIVKRQVTYKLRHSTTDLTLLFTQGNDLVRVDDRGRVEWFW